MHADAGALGSVVSPALPLFGNQILAEAVMWFVADPLESFTGVNVTCGVQIPVCPQRGAGFAVRWPVRDPSSAAIRACGRSLIALTLPVPEL